ncbi:hypothetical protein PV11_01634 [Exophiala sideris]|uniref:Uncharacterized protein n=1 Tax=Exophiala sideris TaxID=1016849 RepID=A0A0D1YWV1_9EURO|nr:hypothetical protein PV11_01634 [Exophiala sideris]
MMFTTLAEILLIVLGQAAAMPEWNYTSTLDLCAATSFPIVQDADSGIWPYRTYVSSNVTPPVLLINVTGGPLQPGLLFFGQENSGIVDAVGEQAAFIMTDTGDLVYGLPGETSNFHTQTLDGRSVLTFRTGSGAAAAEDQVGYGYGEVHILDTGYQEIYTVCPDIDVTTAPQAGNVTCFADVHESMVTEDNTILITVYNTTQADLSEIGGPKDGWVIDPLTVEVDPRTNATLFVWSPLAHVPLTDSHYPLADRGLNTSAPYDYFHTNAIQKYRNGYLINSRHCWTTYFVNGNGSIEWQVKANMVEILERFLMEHIFPGSTMHASKQTQQIPIVAFCPILPTTTSLPTQRLPALVYQSVSTTHLTMPRIFSYIEIFRTRTTRSPSSRKGLTTSSATGTPSWVMAHCHI